jgi:two-component sensor histidine kinase/ABC-type amino acid transport substrate-binding protein
MIIEVKTILKPSLFLFLVLSLMLVTSIGTTDSFEKQNTSKQLNLSPVEKGWLKTKQTVRIRIGHFPPLMFVDNGKIRGIAIDYFEHIMNRSKINFKYITSENVTWPKALEYIAQHKIIDMVPTAKITAERKKRMLFTREYIFAPWVIFTRTDDFVANLDDLKGKTVSVEQGFVIHQMLKSEYPEVNLLVAAKDSDQFQYEAIDALATNRSDAYIGNLIGTTYIIQQKGYTNLKVSAPAPFGNHNQAMAIRNDWPELVSIINKTLNIMSPEEHQEIRNKWLAVRYEYGISSEEIIKWTLIVSTIIAVIFGVILYWNRKLQKEILNRIRIEQELKTSKLELSDFLKEKETLLHEIHHRVKNNLAVISSLLGLQSSTMNDDRLKRALKDSQHRVQSISMIHETLYQSENLASIDMNTYLSKLSRSMVLNYSVGNKINLKIKSENIMIDAKQASSVGLIVNELISNSFKYAFPDERKGKIIVSIKKLDKELNITFKDDGIGIPDGFDWKNTKSLGLKLVRTLVENQLDGSIDMESKNGIKFIIKFNIKT